LLAHKIVDSRDFEAAGLCRFVREHLERIRLTVSYAVGQANNHSISEATALLVGGQWLLAHGTKEDALKAEEITDFGRTLLVRQVNHLVLNDGTFSQYSISYQRMVLDVLSLAEWWCLQFQVPGVKAACGNRVSIAIEWLASMVDKETGRAPNIGANDGTCILALSCADYDDYRPSIQLASALFRDERYFPNGPWDDQCRTLGVDVHALPIAATSNVSRLYPDGGFVVLKKPSLVSWGVIRVPRFRFRPSQADGLHADLWIGSLNVTRDSGSFSYASDSPWCDYFPGTSAHCTCEIDGRDQMPRLGRFLFGNWLQAQYCSQVEEKSDGFAEWCGSYKDDQGAMHRRAVRLEDEAWVIKDDVSGHQKRVVMRWRLAPGNWRLEGNQVESNIARITVDTRPPARRIELTDGWESRHYLAMISVPVLEVELGPGCASLETRIEPKFS